jgi:RAB protein geranylgeranyltransferase component A
MKKPLLVKICFYCVALQWCLPGFGFTGSDATQSIILGGAKSGQNIQVLIFDQTNGERFATVAIDSVKPARRRVGFVSVPAPGYAFSGVSVRLWQQDFCPTAFQNLSALLKNLSKNGLSEPVNWIADQESIPCEWSKNLSLVTINTNPEQK